MFRNDLKEIAVIQRVLSEIDRLWDESQPKKCAKLWRMPQCMLFPLTTLLCLENTHNQTVC